MTKAEPQVVLNTLTEHEFQDAFTKNGRSAGNGAYVRKGTTLGLMMASRTKASFWSDGSASPGNYGWLFVTERLRMFPGSAWCLRALLTPTDLKVPTCVRYYTEHLFTGSTINTILVKYFFHIPLWFCYRTKKLQIQMLYGMVQRYSTSARKQANDLKLLSFELSFPATRYVPILRWIGKAQLDLLELLDQWLRLDVSKRPNSGLLNFSTGNGNRFTFQNSVVFNILDTGQRF
jgi:hypothetical protein